MEFEHFEAREKKHRSSKASVSGSHSSQRVNGLVPSPAQSVNLGHGVRALYTADGSKKISSLDQLEEGKVH